MSQANCECSKSHKPPSRDWAFRVTRLCRKWLQQIWGFCDPVIPLISPIASTSLRSSRWHQLLLSLHMQAQDRSWHGTLSGTLWHSWSFCLMCRPATATACCQWSEYGSSQTKRSKAFISSSCEVQLLSMELVFGAAPAVVPRRCLHNLAQRIERLKYQTTACMHPFASKGLSTDNSSCEPSETVG